MPSWMDWTGIVKCTTELRQTECVCGGGGVSDMTLSQSLTATVPKLVEQSVDWLKASTDRIIMDTAHHVTELYTAVGTTCKEWWTFRHGICVSNMNNQDQEYVIWQSATTFAWQGDKLGPAAIAYRYESFWLWSGLVNLCEKRAVAQWLARCAGDPVEAAIVGSVPGLERVWVRLPVQRGCVGSASGPGRVWVRLLVRGGWRTVFQFFWVNTSANSLMSDEPSVHGTHLDRCAR